LPIYEYQCPHCSHRFEMRQGFNDSAAAICPQCQSRARRLFSPVAIIFKGPGFYVTDEAHNRHNGGGPSKTKSSPPKITSQSND